MMPPAWSTACPDWERRVLAGESLVPAAPLFPDEAAAALAVFDSLRLVDVAGQPTMGETCRKPFRDFVAAIFGAYDAASGRRLIRNFFELVAKKNAKSTRAAAIMVTALIRNWRELGEFYILAPTKEVADNSFLPAAGMVASDPNLRALLHVKPNHRIIEHRNTGAFLKVIAADSDTVSGKKGIGILVDELWLFGKRNDATAMLSEALGGLVSRPEGFVIYLSTQSDKTPAGVFAQKLKEFRAIRDGKVHDPRSLGALYEFPERMLRDGSFKEPRFWHIPNPNLGASVDPEFLADKFAEAERGGRADLAIFCAKHLNVQVDIALGTDGWAGAELWARGAEPGLTLDALIERSEVITIGADGGGLDDLFGLGVIGRERETRRWLGWAHAWISPEGLDRRKANATEYDRFIAAGDLTVVDALPQDIEQIVAIVKRIDESGRLAQVGVDAAGIGAFVDALAEIGITQDEARLGSIRQGIALMGAIKTVERKLADGTVRHAGSALMDWCVGNAKVVPTPTAMRIARDESGFGKIDPLMALFNAAALMAMNPAPTSAARSFWETLASAAE